MFQQSHFTQIHRLILIDPLPTWISNRFRKDDVSSILHIVGHKDEYTPITETDMMPHLALIGIDDLSQDQIEVLQEIKRRWRHIGLTILVPNLKPHDFLRLFTLGVQGYLPWESTFEDIMSALRVVANGGWISGSRIIPQLLGLGSSHYHPDRLTPTELAVIVCVAEDRSNEEISYVLGISTKTIERHISNLLRKTGARSRVGLTRWWFNHITKH